MLLNPFGTLTKVFVDFTRVRCSDENHHFGESQNNSRYLLRGLKQQETSYKSRNTQQSDECTCILATMPFELTITHFLKHSQRGEHVP